MVEGLNQLSRKGRMKLVVEDACNDDGDARPNIDNQSDSRSDLLSQRVCHSATQDIVGTLRPPWGLGEKESRRMKSKKAVNTWS